MRGRDPFNPNAAVDDKPRSKRDHGDGSSRRGGSGGRRKRPLDGDTGKSRSGSSSKAKSVKKTEAEARPTVLAPGTLGHIGETGVDGLTVLEGPLDDFEAFQSFGAGHQNEPFSIGGLKGIEPQGSFSDQEFPRDQLPQLFQWSPPKSSTKRRAPVDDTDDQRLLGLGSPEKRAAAANADSASSASMVVAGADGHMASFVTPHRGRRLTRRRPSTNKKAAPEATVPENSILKEVELKAGLADISGLITSPVPAPPTTTYPAVEDSGERVLRFVRYAPHCSRVCPFRANPYPYVLGACVCG